MSAENPTANKIIRVTDVILRDAHQSLMATRMRMEDMIPACEDLDNAGFWSLECWGGATFDACIRFLNEDPWQRLRTFKQLMPKTPLQMLLRGQNLLGYRHYGDDVVRHFVDKAAANGMDVFRIFDALNDLRNLEVAIAAVRQTGKHAQGCISFTVSPVHTVAAFVDQAKRLQDMGVDSLCIKDMAALIKPQQAYDLVQGIKAGCGDELPVHLHVHATTGVTMVSLMKAIEAGCDGVDTANPAMCLGTGHNPTDAFCEMLEGTPYGHQIDLGLVRKVKKHFEAVKPKYAEFCTKYVGVSTEIFESQIPGGMLSNMESQLKQQGAGDKMDAVLEEVPRVRKVAGYPPLVTPSSQIVGTQAVFNVLMGPYKRLTGEFADLMLGYYGETISQKDPEIIKIAAAQMGKEAITCRPADLISDEWESLTKTAAATKGFNGSDEDVLTLAMFPQVAPKFFGERADKAEAPAPASSPKAVSQPIPQPGGPGEDFAVSIALTVRELPQSPGGAVSEGDIILIGESRGRRVEITAPRAGRLVSYAVKPGDALPRQALICQLG
ncbi:MAG: oxaloacetate decarboxylase [Planctomycetota bacterium]|nr:MAG: oxaloacetate decarboxylase [Planctomycetota bacterium]